MFEFLEANAVALQQSIKALLAALPGLPAQIATILSSTSPTGSAVWHLMWLAVGCIIALAGYFIARFIDQWGKRQFKNLFNPQPADRAEKIFYLLARAVLQTVVVVVMFAVGALLALLIQRDPISLNTMLMVVAIASVARFGRVIFMNLLAPDTPSHRLLAFDDNTASSLARILIITFGVAYANNLIFRWLGTLGLDETGKIFGAVLTMVFAIVMLCWISISYRREIAVAIRGGETSLTSAPVLILTRFWHVIAVGYFLIAGAVTIVRLLLGMPSAAGLVGAPVLGLLVGIVVYAILLTIVDRVGKRKSADDEPVKGMQRVDTASASMRDLVERLASVAAILVAVGFTLWRWGIDLSADAAAANIFKVAMVLLAGWFGNRAITVWINRKIELEGGIDTAEPGEEGPGHGGVSRIAMLLSLFRKFLSITVLVIVAMIALSELGIDVAPLFASAGIVGLAIGFGAQALVRDIFSGAFFLMDDAFRIGEYIDVGSVKGTVEKISVRSMQLRHHMGALHTIPFGEISHLTNYSRDWVMMKLKLRVTYDTDIDKVRKLIKKLGQDLLQDPEVGDKFMQPLKSQGVYSMEDESALIIRVKFMTKPGDQFQTRKVVYGAVRELFEREGIKIAKHREVVVRVADDEAGSDDAHTLGGAAAIATQNREEPSS